MTRRVLLGMLLLVAALGAGFYVRSRSSGTTRAASAAGAGSAAATGAHASGDPASARPLPTWFGDAKLPARRIAGRVTYGGQPVAGAEVRLESSLTRAGQAGPPPVVTGADGRFDLGAPIASGYTVTANARDRAPAIVRVDTQNPDARPPTDQLELVLHDCGVAVHGTVSDASGGPIVRARVRLEGLVGVETGEDGSYQLCLQAGDHAVQYSADGYGGVQLSIDASNRVRRDVVLVPEAAIVGRVVRKDDRSPVAGAMVSAWPREWGSDRAAGGSVIADEDGRFRITGLLAGTWSVTAWSEDLYNEAATSVTIEAVRTSEEVVIELARTRRVSGRVVAGGQPVVGAAVTLVRKNPLARSAPAFSQADGSFVLETVPVGELIFTVEGMEVTSPGGLTVAAGADVKDVVVEVVRLPVVYGTVTRKGQPVADASVRIATVGTQSGADGTYRAVGVPAGTHVVIADSVAAGAFTASGKVTVGKDDVQHDIELESGGRITGQVVDQDGKPAAGVFVSFVHVKTGDLCRATTDEQGGFDCTEMTGGADYKPHVYPWAGATVEYAPADGKPFAMVRVTDGDTTVEKVKLAIKLEQLDIAGHVVDSTGQPVADARIRALEQGDEAPKFNPWLSVPATTSAVDGSFKLSGLAPGSYALQARTGEGGAKVVTDVAAGNSQVVITVERPGLIAGTLVGYQDPPVIYVQPLGGSMNFFPAQVDGTHFRSSGLPPGKYLVNAQNTYEGLAQVVEVRAGQASEVTLASGGHGAIDAVVHDFKTGAPMAGIVCHAVLAAGDDYGVTNWDPGALPRSDTSGKLTIDPAPAGDVVLECVDRTGKSTRLARRATVPRGGRASVELRLVTIPDDAGNGNPGFTINWRSIDARIEGLDPKGPAAAAGMKNGDLIVSIDGVDVTPAGGIGTLMLIAIHSPGDRLALGVRRGGQLLAFTVVLGIAQY